MSNAIAPQRSWPAYRALSTRPSISASRLLVQPSNHGLDREADQFSAVTGNGLPSSSVEVHRPEVAPASVGKTISEPGVPLDQRSRQFFEPILHRDISNVRIHTGHLADRSTQSLNASAYTVGNHIVFRRGYFRPHTSSGRGLLAHELAHVVQQSEGRTTSVQCHDLPEQVIPGSTHLSRVVQAYRRDNHHVGDSINLMAVEYSTSDGVRQTHVFENRPGVAHTEVMVDEFFRQQGSGVQIHEMYSERQPCGPSDQDCEARIHQIVRRRGRRGTDGEPQTRTTYGYQYQEAVHQDGTRARRSRERISDSAERTRRTGNLEWDFPRREPPPHHERSEGGPRTRRSRRLRIPTSRIRRSQRGAVSIEVAGLIPLIAAFLAGWLEGAISGNRLSNAIKARVPDVLQQAIRSDENLVALIDSATATMREGVAYVDLYAIVEAEYSSESVVVWQDIEETQPYLEAVRISHFSDAPLEYEDRQISHTQPQFNVFEERNRIRFSMPLEFEQTRTQHDPEASNDPLRQQLRALGMPIPAGLQR
ncbi:eCIS core domain-containing protein [Enterovibrio norvegicus]|uniref:eCIS core domain-containing protein n=1 Tax=Enterovibrio norvegicus TaxID=188144 RepID=UPI0002D37B86|nr:DUF4157 domain-containing protein [Enterovibrio norvegicus]